MTGKFPPADNYTVCREHSSALNNDLNLDTSGQYKQRPTCNKNSSTVVQFTNTTKQLLKLISITNQLSCRYQLIIPFLGLPDEYKPNRVWQVWIVEVMCPEKIA